MGVLKKRTFDCINVDIDKDSNVCQESVTFIIPYLQRAYTVSYTHLTLPTKA